MKEFNEVTLTELIKIPLKKIMHFTRNDEVLGFIIAEEFNQDNETVTVFTPFTNAGLLTETNCFMCAIQSLIKLNEGVANFQPCDRRPSFGVEVHVISFGRQLH